MPPPGPGHPVYGFQGPPGQPGQHPPNAGFPGQGVPYGAPAPYPGGVYPPHPGGQPPKKSRKGLWLLAGLFGFATVLALMIAVSVALEDPSDFENNVADTTEVRVGDCLTVGELAGELEVETVDCGYRGFHYAVAARVQTRNGCGIEYAAFWYEERPYAGARPRIEEVLCLAQVYQQGLCYSEPPTDVPNPLAKVNEVDCSRVTLVPGGTNYFKVETKVAAAPECTEGQVEYFAAKPTPAGYCLTYFEP